MIRTFTLHTALTLLTICSAALQALAQPSAPELPPWVIDDARTSLAMADPPGSGGPSALIDQALGSGYLEKLENA
ncbi:MAG: hypothetical protein KDE56_25580, partial [Anaerolineales bacterium]|nr:hypothetical protein [Anaerolineales bacterium]